MDGTFQAAVRFQDSDMFQKAIKMAFEMHVVCEFSPVRIQTLIWSQPCSREIIDAFSDSTKACMLALFQTPFK